MKLYPEIGDCPPKVLSSPPQGSIEPPPPPHPAAHFALREPQPENTHIIAKPPSKSSLVLVLDSCPSFKKCLLCNDPLFPFLNHHMPLFQNLKHYLGVKFSGLFFSRELCRKAPIVGANLKGAVRISTENGGKFAENRALTDVNRCYFGVDGRFSAVNRR